MQDRQSAQPQPAAANNDRLIPASPVRQLRVGAFRYYFDEDRWEWSAELAAMHGYQPTPMAPSTDQMLLHKHPEDLPELTERLARIRRTREPFSNQHRILDATGRVRHVIVFGEELCDADGRVVGSEGFCVDITAEEKTRQEALSARVEEISEQRSAIEQAKGMLMMVYGISADAAFDLLRWRSQESNVKLRRLAEQVVTDFTHAQHDGAAPERYVFDKLLLSAHLRAREQATP